MKIKLEFKWQDAWVGVYWERKLNISIGELISTCPKMEWNLIKHWTYHIWICLIPCIPIHIQWEEECTILKLKIKFLKFKIRHRERYRKWRCKWFGHKMAKLSIWDDEMYCRRGCGR